MPAFGPISRRALIGYLRQVGFEGPYPGGNREYMERGELKVHNPNAHRGDIRHDLLARILRQTRISRDEWESL